MKPDPAESRTTHESQIVRDDHVEMLLDLALEANFPWSDALALLLGADRARTKPAELRYARNTDTRSRNCADVRAAQTARVGSGSFRNGNINP